MYDLHLKDDGTLDEEDGVDNPADPAVKKTKAFEEAQRVKNLREYDESNVLQMGSLCTKGMFWHIHFIVEETKIQNN